MKGENVRREIGMMTSRTMVTYSNPLGSVGHLRKQHYLFTISINISLLTIAAVCFSVNVAVAQTQETRKVTATADDGSTVTVQEITIASTKNAECTLTYSNGASSSSMQVWADDLGIVHLWTQRKSPQDKSTDETYVLKCDERGTIAKYVLDLYDPATFLKADPREKEEGRTTLPALKDPMRVDQADLIKAGYPPRPDPVLAPTLYEKWLDIVSHPITLINNPFIVARPGEYAGSGTEVTDTVWGGPMLYGANRYVLAYAAIPVPVFSEESAPNGAALLWTGLDGFASNVIIQDGVKFEMNGGIGTYRAWFEYYCLEEYPNCWLQEDESIEVSPGDIMLVWAWEGDYNCNYGAGYTGYGCYLLWNYTTGYANGWRIEAPVNRFIGKTAEGIFERYVGRPVSAFMGARIDFAALDSNGYEHNLNTDNYVNVTLVGSSGNRLVESRPTAPYSAYFFWNASE